MSKYIDSILIDILTQEMALSNDQIWSRNQDVKLPNDERLYIALGETDSRIIANNNNVIDDPLGMKQLQGILRRVNVQIDIFSSSTEALFRHWEVPVALTSVYSVQQQEKEDIKIFRIPANFVNTTETEGSKRLNKFSINVTCFVLNTKEQILSSPTGGDYYNQFFTRVDDEQTIGEENGIIEFQEISPALDFVTVWDTAKAGVSASNQVQLPFQSNGVYDCLVDYGDGTSVKHITAWNQAETLHTYASPGIYTIKISGIVNGWIFNNGGDKSKLIEVSQWGNLKLGTTQVGHFLGCDNLIITAVDIPDLKGVITLRAAFQNCVALTNIPNLSDWRFDDVASFESFLQGCTSFNQDLIGLNMPVATTIKAFLGGCSSFNGSVSGWQFPALVNLESAFGGCSIFTGIGLETWDVSSVQFFVNTFGNCLIFNGDVSGWNMSSAISLANLFINCPLFNRDLSSWVVSNVTTFALTFRQCPLFNSDISGWDTSSAVSFAQMFNAAVSFDQDLGSWVVTSLIDAASMMVGVTLSTSNYDSLLIGWDGQSLQSGVNAHFGLSKYSAAAAAARANIVNTDLWTITDGGQAP